MIADCSPNAKAAMLHGLLTAYIVETDDDSDLPCHITFDFQTCIPDCYPEAKELRLWCNSWIESKITETEFARELELFLESDHSRCENHHPCQADDDVSPVMLTADRANAVACKFEDGQIINANDVYGFYVLPLATCAMNSAWDFPSFVMLLDLEHLWDCDIGCVMHPDRDDAVIIADAMGFEDPACREKFINEFPLLWDT